MRTRATAVLAAAVLVAVAGCGDLASTGDELDDEHQFPFSGERLEIENRNADLRIVAGTGDAVEVERSLTGKATHDGNATLELADGTLTLDVTCSALDLTASLSVVVVGAESAELTATSTEDRVELQSSAAGEVDATVPTDRDSDRAIEAVAENGSVSIQAGDDHA